MATKDITDLQVCLAVLARDALRAAGVQRGLHLDDILAAWTGQHPKVCLRALERACGRRLIEYGTWILGAWLEPAGRALLAAQPLGADNWAGERFRVGDLVTRDGTDVQLVVALDAGDNCGTFLCVVPPASGWCEQWETESNLVRRYSRTAGTVVGDAAELQKQLPGA